MPVIFKNNSAQVKLQLEAAILTALHEIGGEVSSSAAKNSRVDTGQLKGSWAYQVGKDGNEVIIGNPLENAIWEEFGTGEYALNGDGRKGGWAYKNKDGETVFTRGKRPNRALHKAITKLKPQITKYLKSIGDSMK